jgi:nitrite reductase (NADH) large subunit
MNVVMVGNGVAGVSATETIRAADKNCEITIVSDESYPFYSRPRLIDLLARKTSVEQITIHAQGWYDKNAVRLITSTRVKGIDADGKRVFTDRGTGFCYDKLVIATGALSLVPPVTGMEGNAVVTLRTIEDVKKIWTLASEGRKAVVVGGGLLGIEAANSLVALGVKVQVLEVCGRLLPRQLDNESSAIIQKLFEKKEMTFLTGAAIQSVERNSDGGLRIACSNGKETRVDFMVVSAGIKPDCSIAEGTPVGLNRGIVVDDFMRTTVRDIYACGDAAEHRGALYGLWQPAREQGIVCGSHIGGKEVPYEGTMNSVRLKVAGIELASIGDVERKEGVREVTEKDDGAGLFKKIFLRGQRVVGAILIGNVREAVQLQQMIKKGEQYSP